MYRLNTCSADRQCIEIAAWRERIRLAPLAHLTFLYFAKCGGFSVLSFSGSRGEGDISRRTLSLLRIIFIQ